MNILDLQVERLRALHHGDALTNGQRAVARSDVFSEFLDLGLRRDVNRLLAFETIVEGQPEFRQPSDSLFKRLSPPHELRSRRQRNTRARPTYSSPALALMAMRSDTSNDAVP